MIARLYVICLLAPLQFVAGLQPRSSKPTRKLPHWAAHLKRKNGTGREARRNKLIGEWVSDILGYNESQRETYIQAVIASDFKKAGDEDVFEKVKNDLDGKNISDEDLRKKMNEFFEIAKSSIK